MTSCFGPSLDSRDDAIGRVVPSAKVVGILQRSWREYVASISEEVSGLIFSNAFGY